MDCWIHGNKSLKNLCTDHDGWKQRLCAYNENNCTVNKLCVHVHLSNFAFGVVSLLNIVIRTHHCILTVINFEATKL